MRILIVTPHIFMGGAEKVLLNMAYNLKPFKCNVSIATLSLDLSKFQPHLKKLNFLLPESPIKPPIILSLETAVKASLREIRSLMSIIEGCVEDFDLLNPHNFPAYWVSGVLKKKKSAVWMCNETLGPYGQTRDLYDRNLTFRLAFEGAKMLDRLLVNSTIDRIVTCSDYNNLLIKKRYGREADVINTCVDYAFFRREVSDAKGRLGFREEESLLLHVGSLIKKKNQLLSILALKKLKFEMGSIKLIIVGEGPWKNRLKRLASSLNLDRDVIFLGQVTEEKLRCLYHACDINLYAVNDQTWGLTPYEALAAGKPSIVSNNCGAAGPIIRESLGVVIEPNLQSLVDATRFVLKNPDLVEKMVDRGRKFVEENLTYKIYTNKIFEIFKESIN